jgi:glucans biosynthesis protein
MTRHTQRSLPTWLTAALAACSAVWLLASPPAQAQPVAAPAFGFEQVAELARQAAQQPYAAPSEQLPAELAALDYDALRDLRYRPERAIWREQGLPFELQFFHLGGGNRNPVAVHEVVDGQPRRIGYDPSAWHYGAQAQRRGLQPGQWGELGYAGFRVHHALNDPAYKDELVVFLGASYFRALGRGQQYGLSARGLAIDTVGAPAGASEEFPRFSAFWIERPAPGASSLVIHALLDSPRATGAYRFELQPGTAAQPATQMDVRARLFLRAGIAPEAAIRTLGIAPLTSMFLHGPQQTRGSDFRPRVHDSEGLLVAGQGLGSAPGAPVEWLWRPLFNPSQPLASSFALQRLQGFGLMQRERRLAGYEDIEARYERRPSTWVEPLGDWGPGRVELLLLPTPDETHDNIAAYWVPATLPAPGQALELAWRLHWQGDAPTQPPLAQTLQSRRGFSWFEPKAPPAAGEQKWQIDFDGPALRALPPAVRSAEGEAGVEAVVTLPPVAGRPVARLLEARAIPHPDGGWRLHLRLLRDPSPEPVEVRAFLRHAGSALTETWSALIPQDPTPLNPQDPR